jgi:hypothetical protein
MFGNDDQQTQASNPVDNGGFNPSGFTPPAAMTSTPASMPDPAQPVSQPEPQSPVFDSPSVAPITSPEPLETPELPAVGTPDPIVSDDNVSPSSSTPSGASDELLDLKQQALQQLSPLVNQLEQTPEEKFRTTMMMIQASDDQTLLKTAYDAAQAITDEKSRAQALLDVINEINYFTQHGNQA